MLKIPDKNFCIYNTKYFKGKPIKCFVVQVKPKNKNTGKTKIKNILIFETSFFI